MLVKDITNFLESIAPTIYQEEYDNTGLIIGSFDKKVDSALICLDCTEDVIDEAICTKTNLIIAHHPIIFKGIKKLNDKNYVERIISKAIRNEISIYAIHTNLDNIFDGVNKKIAERLGLINGQILFPKNHLLKKLITFSPRNHTNQIRQALFDAGAGKIGNYDQCSFNTSGKGTFRGNAYSNPFIGSKGIQQNESEDKIEVIYPIAIENNILNALFKVHPYETIAYDIIPLDNHHPYVGSGFVGDLPNEMETLECLKMIKKNMATSVIKHTGFHKSKIKKIAICGGSGSFLLSKAIEVGADLFLSADFKYHEFFDADKRITIADIGHYESEQFTQDYLLEIITKKFPNFATRLTSYNTNPVKYLV